MSKVKLTGVNAMSEEQQRQHELWYYQFLKWQAEGGNKIKDKPKSGYDCPKCLNKGFYFVADAESLTLVGVDCDCIKNRSTYRAIAQSGLQKQIASCTFENFETTHQYQYDMKTKAQDFVKEPYGKWFFLGGRSGSGKTHICTAICHEFLKQGKAVRYMKWKTEAVHLKALVTDAKEYQTKIDTLKNVEVLYIDDLLKTQKGTQPTAADINLAFEIIDARYTNTDLITLISSELNMFDIIAFDEATGGRIKEMVQDMTVSLAGAENYRLR